MTAPTISVNQRYLWNYRTYTTTSQYTCCTQTDKHFTMTTLLMSRTKTKRRTDIVQGAVCKIKCCDCQATYIGETGRSFSTRLTEHKRATRNDWWRQQSHCWTPFTGEASNRLGLCANSVNFLEIYWSRRMYLRNLVFSSYKSWIQ